MTTAETGAEGGAGGKFRKRAVRQSSTPYDRPPSALRPSTMNVGWISKLVDPASKLITSGANRLFASLFHKRLLPSPAGHPSRTSPSLPQDSNQAQRVTFQDAILADAPRQKTEVVESLCNSSDGTGIDIVELEKILKQKTYTRSQIDRLMGLLHENTSTLDSSPGNTQKQLESDSLEPVSSGNINAEVTVKENGIASRGLHSVALTNAGFEEEAASPLELAKAYMVNKPPKASPSMSGSHSQFLKGSTLLSNPSSPAFHQKSSIASPALGSSFHKGGLDNGFNTPRSCNRSTLYRMNRTPYFRALPMNVHTGVKSTHDCYGELPPSSSHCTMEKDGLLESRQVLKRRSSVIDDDIRQGGPIRRIRQKSNLLSAKKTGLSVSGTLSSIHGTGAGSDDIHHYFSSRGALLLDESNHKTSKMPSSDCHNNDICPSHISVPPQTTEMAAKIFQTLNVMVHSPLKGKTPELKLSAERKMSPVKLTTDMLRGQALRSEENVDISKLLQCVEDNSKLDSSCSGSPDVHNTFPQNQDKVEEKCSNNFVSPSEVVVALGPSCSDTPAENNVRNKTFFSAAGASTSQTKQSFKMSAHEDLDLDDDYCTNETASGVMTEGNEKIDTFVRRNDSATEAFRAENISSSIESKDLTSLITNKKADLGTFTEKNFSFTFSSPTTTVQSSASVCHSSSAINSGLAPNKPTATPLFNFGAGAVNCVGESSLSRSAASSPNPQSSSSVGLEPVRKIHEMHKMGNKEMEKDGNFSSKPSAGASSADHHLSSSNASVFPTPVFSSKLQPDAANGFKNHIFTTPSSSTISPPASTSHASPVSAAPSLSAVPPVFKIQPSATPETAAAGDEARTLQEKSVQSNSSFGGFSSRSSFPTTGNINNQSVSCSEALGCGSESLASVQPSSHSSSSVFGIGSSSSVSSNMFSSSSAFGLNSSSSVPQPNTASSAVPSSTSNPFGSGWKSPQSPFFGLTAPSTGFSFDSSSSSSTPPMVFASSASASAPSTIFGLSSSASSAPSSVFASSSSSSSSSSASAPLFAFGSSSSSSSAFAPSTMYGSSSSSAASAPLSVFSSSPSSSSSSVSAPMVFGLPSSSSSASAPLSVFGSSSSSGTVPSMVFGSSSSFVSSTVFGSSSASTPSMVFGSSSSVPAASMPFSSSSAFSAPPMGFGSSSGSSQSAVTGSSSVFSQNVFGNNNSVFGSNDSMNMEDSMAAEPSMPASVPVFGQTAPPPFQFGGQAAASPFQAGAGGVDMSGAGGGSFSLGGGGTPKQGRRIVKVTRRKGR